MVTNQKKDILLVNDHYERTGIGNYFFKIFEIFRKMGHTGYSFEMLMQNMKRNYVSHLPDISVQFRPLWFKSRQFCMTYDLLSYFYFPKLIPRGYSIYHISSQMMGNSVSFIRPTVITCCDLIPFKFRKNHDLLSEHLRRKSIAAMTKASFIIFISNSTKQDFLELFDFNESKTAVIYGGADDVFKKRDKATCREELGFSPNRPVILHVGTEEPRKNIKNLFLILNKIRRNIPDILLIRIGRKRSVSKGIINKLSLENNVRYFRTLPEEKLAKIYNAADVFIFPSIYEGFGLPVLEALKSGCPIVASKATSIPEITGNAAILHNPRDICSFVNSIEKLLNDHLLRESYISKELARAQEFNWEKTAKETIEVYKKVV